MSYVREKRNKNQQHQMFRNWSGSQKNSSRVKVNKSEKKNSAYDSPAEIEDEAMSGRQAWSSCINPLSRSVPACLSVRHTSLYRRA